MHQDDTPEWLFVCAKIPAGSGPLKETVTVGEGLEMGRRMERRGKKKDTVWNKNAFNVHGRWLGGRGFLFCFAFFKQRGRFPV